MESITIQGFKIDMYKKYVHITQIVKGKKKKENKIVIPHEALKEISLGVVIGHLLLNEEKVEKLLKKINRC